MLRAVAGVIVGYIVMVVLVFGTFTCAYLLMGADNAFRPGTYDASVLWLVVSFALGLIAAVVGGVVCAAITKAGSAAPKALAAVVIVLGLAMAVPVFMGTRPDPGPRTGDVPNMEAMMKAKQPKWVAVANPLVGALGVVIGAGLARKKPAGQA